MVFLVFYYVLVVEGELGSHRHHVNAVAVLNSPEHLQPWPKQTKIRRRSSVAEEQEHTC